MDERATIKLFSETECKQIVKNALQVQNVSMKSFSVECGSSDFVGFMGEYYILHVNVADKSRESEHILKLRYFVKAAPTAYEDEYVCRNIFGTESYIYTEILPNLQKYAPTKLFPRCVYTRHDLLVLEDLTSHGFGHMERHKTYELQHHKLVLAHLAQLHASSLAWEIKEQGIMFLAKRYPKFQTPQIQKLINERLFNVLTNLEHYAGTSKEFRNVFCHRDTWDRNILFKLTEEKATNCCIVDFQLSRYCPPALDVLFFLHGSTTAAQRKDHMKEYLAHYYTSLQACLRHLHLPEDIITKTEYEKSCRIILLPVLIIWAMSKQLTMMPDELSNKMRGEEKFEHYMNVQRDEFFLRVMEIDPTYESKIMPPIEELIEYLLEYNGFK